MAVTSLATGTARIQERLCNAIIGALGHLRMDEVPADLRPLLGKIHERTDRVEQKEDEGRLRATLSQMSDREAVQLAHHNFEPLSHTPLPNHVASKSIPRSEQPDPSHPNFFHSPDIESYLAGHVSGAIASL